MKYLSKERWATLPLEDYRPRFFLEVYREKLSMHTPHFHQSRLMNVFSSCSEALIYVEDHRKTERSKAYVLSALNEIENCWESDPIAKDLFAHLAEPSQQLFRKIRGEEFSASHINRLRVMCNAILALEETYVTKLAKALLAAISGTTDLVKMARSTTAIYVLTGLYITHLLNKGYSPTYLFNRVSTLTYQRSYVGRTFEQLFSTIEEKLRNNKNLFDVYFALRANRARALLDIQNDSDVEFFEKMPEEIQAQHVNKLQKDFEFNVIAKAAIESTDYVSASWRVKEKLDKVLDAVTALELNPRIETSAICVVHSKNQQMHHAETLNIDVLINFLSSEGGTYFSNSGTSILRSLAVLDEPSREHLGRSLRYLRLARNSISLEQKLLNLWISLESIYGEGENGILSNILEYVPQIYAVTAVRRRVCYIKDLLIKNVIHTTAMASEKFFDNAPSFYEATDAKIFSLIRDEAACTEVFQSLDDRHHLKFRILSVREELANNKVISNRLGKSEQDVERQLRRIYFLRNKIAHTGHYSNIRPQLITHLLDYIAVCYMAVASSAQAAPTGRLHSMNDLVAAYKMGTEVIFQRAKSGNEITDFDQLIPRPVI